MWPLVVALLSLVGLRLPAQHVLLEQWKTADWTLGVAHAGNLTQLPEVLIVHGSPGSWQDLQMLLKHDSLTCRTRVWAVDRPGYGLSGHEAVTSLVEQAKRISLVLQQARRPVVLVGHSLGGPIVLAMAARYPNKVAAVVLAASSGDPSLEEIRWFQKVARWRALRWMVPQVLDVCNEEMLVQVSELAWLADQLPAIQVPVTILQGDKDSLVPAANADYLAHKLCNARVTVQMLPGEDHFFPFAKSQIVVDAILPFLVSPR